MNIIYHQGEDGTYLIRYGYAGNQLAFLDVSNGEERISITADPSTGKVELKKIDITGTEEEEIEKITLTDPYIASLIYRIVLALSNDTGNISRLMVRLGNSLSRLIKRTSLAEIALLLPAELGSAFSTGEVKMVD